MSLVLQPLASGSKGNATLIKGRLGSLLIDAGLSKKRIVERLRQVGHRPEDLDAVLLTHWHKDHTRGASLLCRRMGIPLYATPACMPAQKPELLRQPRTFRPGESFEVGEFKVESTALPHDAPETVAFFIEAQGLRVGIVTDLGHPFDPGLPARLRELDALLLEFNHDEELLHRGPYPPFLKERILSREGHLSNAQAGSLLEQSLTGRHQVLFAAHLSETNNRPEIAMEQILRSCHRAGRADLEVHLCLQDQPTQAHWF
ncbi:MAG TPA: MBL fold metallo-hydrolase [Planctomycetes bacterium]|nr:MBL fold metallo-hydrolase [Planctomycetota bacterium]